MVQLNDHPVIFGDTTGVLNRIDFTPYTQVVVLTDVNTRAYCLPKILHLLLEERFWIAEIPDGEQEKNLSTCEDIWSAMLDQKVDRKALFLNLGGGVIGDMGGLAASLYKRGIDFINIPTTLLSMVDATTGGKLGVDFNFVKNAIGLFRSPKEVYIVPEFLQTLPKEHLKAGYAEMLKHGLIADRAYLEQLMNAEANEISNWLPLIQQSVEIKQAIVRVDPTEQGPRKQLNFGHTIGHALESYALERGRELLHGHAVAFGMIAELFLSYSKTGFPEATLNRVVSYLSRTYGQYLNIDIALDNFTDLIYQDKKNTGQQTAFTLLADIAKPLINVHCTHQEIEESLAFLRQQV